MRVKNWQSFQHYKQRNPPWIRLYRGLLDDAAFHAMPDASRALAPMLWLLASEAKTGGELPSIADMAWRLRVSVEVLVSALKPLIERGFVEGASDVLAHCKQDATPETETETETETEIPLTRPREGRLLDEIECPTCGRVGYLKQHLARGQNQAGFWCRQPGGCGGNFPLLLPAIVSQLTPNAQNALQSIAAESVKGVGAKARRRAPSWDSGAFESDPASDAALGWISEHWAPSFEPKSRDDLDALLTGSDCPSDLVGAVRMLLLAREYPYLREVA